MKRLTFLSIIATGWLLIIACCTIEANSITVLQSRTNCCSITIDRGNNVVTYTTEDDRFEFQFEGEQDLEDEVNSFQDFCYRHHFNQ